MNENSTQQSSIMIDDIQDILDRYILELKKNIPIYLKDHLVLSHCLRLQTKHIAKDFFRNPINVLWAIPYFSIRKILEFAEKMGSAWAKIAILKIPKILRTDYQKEIEQSILNEVFGFSKNNLAPSHFEQMLRAHSKLQKISPIELKNIILIVERDIKSEVTLQFTKQQEITSLAASAAVIFIAHKRFGSNSLDIFGIGKEIATIYAKNEAVSHFVFGRTLGRAYYKYAPPTPTSKQVLIATVASIIIFSLLASVIGVLSYPVQNKLGLCRKQLQSLLDSTYDKVIVTVIKSLRKI
ncbi:MAG: hypothetical protein H7281_00560 [Bacteriovorax sp.]|nr:hypothetical protein [Bacteriovorax sp.]